MTTPARSRSVLAGLVVAVLGALVVAGLYAVAVVDPTGRTVDHALMRAAERAGASWRGDALGLLDLVGVASVGLALLVVAAVAVARGRPGRGVAAVAVVLGAQAVTQVLKAVLPRDGEDGSLPSGHVTVVASLVVAAILVLFDRRHVLRPLAVAAGGVLVAGTGVATMVAGWHRPSDVLAAVAVVAAVTGLVLAAEALLERPAVPARSASTTPTVPLPSGRQSERSTVRISSR